MGTVPLLTREGEVEIAKRIERGKLAVIKSISRTPTIARVIMQMGDALKNDERSIRELVIFVDEELTDEKIDDRKKQVLRQIRWGPFRCSPARVRSRSRSASSAASSR